MTDPIDETQPHATSPSPPTPSPPTPSVPAVPTASEPAAPTPAAPAPAAPAPAASKLRVDPDGPKATDWREPPWFPPGDKRRGPSRVALVAGLALVGIGLYLFLDRTLGGSMPRIQWSTVWPVILIAIGAIVMFRSVRRRS